MRPFILILVLLSFLSGSVARSPTYVPIATRGADTGPATFTVLIDYDTTFVTAALIPGGCRVILTYIDRAHGNRLHVVEDLGTAVKELPLPSGVPSIIGPRSPAFEYPGPKQASGFPLVVCGRLRVYANTRLPDDTSGPFKLTKIDMPVP